MNELIVLSINDDRIVASVTVPEKQKRIRALNDWIKAKGQDGIVYRMAKFVTPPVRAEETKVMQPVSLPLSEDPKPKPKDTAKNKSQKPEAVEA